MSGTRFNIVHISDLHISKEAETYGMDDWNGLKKRHILLLIINFICSLFNKSTPKKQRLFGSYSEKALDAFLKEMNDKESIKALRVDAVAVTGDLTSYGHPDDFQIVKKLFEGHRVLNFDNINNSTSNFINSHYKFDVKKLCILPGNHDRYKNGPLCLPGSTTFENLEYFNKDWNMGAGNTTLNSRVNFTTLNKNGQNLHLICADFTHFEFSFKRLEWLNPIYWTFCNILGMGRVDKKTLNELCNTTDSLKKTGAVIWLTHFNPDHKCNWKIRLKRAKKLIQAATANEIKVILSGHTHINSRTKINGVEIICVGSLCANMRGRVNSYNELSLTITNDTVTDISVQEMHCIKISNKYKFQLASI